MNQSASLRSLEGLLETFLEKVLRLKQKRLSVIDGINNLDEIARTASGGLEITDEIGDWFAKHSKWLNESVLTSAENGRIGNLLREIRKDLDQTQDTSPARMKIDSQVSRWTSHLSGYKPQKIVLKRPPEVPGANGENSIDLCLASLEKITNRLKDLKDGREHILTAVDDALKSALVQENREALLLSAYIIYYLKQNGYLVEPYVKRLKEAERLLKERAADA